MFIILFVNWHSPQPENKLSISMLKHNRHSVYVWILPSNLCQFPISQSKKLMSSGMNSINILPPQLQI